MKEFDLWDSDNEIVKKAYQRKNYRIWDREIEGNRCLILFSGNGLFYPNTEIIFSDVILKRDRYEYQNLAKSNYLCGFRRIIFVRDIHKQWYITGINEECPDVFTTAELLKKETKGYTVTAAGNSAGGYAAVLFGLLIDAEMIFSFSGQYDITGRKYAPFIEQYNEDELKSRFYNLRSLFDRGDARSKIYYFWPDRCEDDRLQHELVKGAEAIRSFEFISEKHERTVLPFQIPYLLSLDKERMEQLYRKYQGRKIHAWHFLFSSMGILRGIAEVYHYLRVKITSRRGCGN